MQDIMFKFNAMMYHHKKEERETKIMEANASRKIATLRDVTYLTIEGAG